MTKIWENPDAERRELKVRWEYEVLLREEVTKHGWFSHQVSGLVRPIYMKVFKGQRNPLPWWGYSADAVFQEWTGLESLSPSSLLLYPYIYYLKAGTTPRVNKYCYVLEQFMSACLGSGFEFNYILRQVATSFDSSRTLFVRLGAHTLMEYPLSYEEAVKAEWSELGPITLSSVTGTPIAPLTNAQTIIQQQLIKELTT